MNFRLQEPVPRPTGTEDPGKGLKCPPHWASFAGDAEQIRCHRPQRWTKVSEPEFDPPFEILEPCRLQAPMLVNSPHSGDWYPATFLARSRLGTRDLRRSADLFMDRILLGTLERGIPLMLAHFPRSFLDVNREPYELDPKMFDGRVPSYANTRSLRVTSGYGAVPRLVAESVEIYARRIPIAEALRRIDQYYLPYHAALRRRLNALQRSFGSALLLDCHSMPSASIANMARQPDVVLGDRHGTSCAPEVMDYAEATLRSLGCVVARNQPYAGGFITEHYGAPLNGVHALQVEINRALYMDEAAFEPHQGLDQVSELMMQFLDALKHLQLPEPSQACPLAAE